jgi:hypothetical protein
MDTRVKAKKIVHCRTSSDELCYLFCDGAIPFYKKVAIDAGHIITSSLVLGLDYQNYTTLQPILLVPFFKEK